MKKSILILALIIGLVIVLTTKNKQETQSKPIGLKIYPPDESLVTSPENGKFIIFTRESLSEKDWHHSANAWEFDPHQLPYQLVKRTTFKQSDWKPYVLSDSPTERSAGLVRLQAAKDPLGDNVTVDLYDIDYRTWNVEKLLTRGMLNYLGEEGDNFYIETERGIEIINLKTREVSLRKETFELWSDNGKHWLTSRGNGEHLRYFLFDPARDIELKELPLTFPPAYYKSALSPDSRYLTQLAPISWEDLKSRQKEAGVEWSFTVSLESQLHILNLETSESFTTPIRRYATVGSGVPVWGMPASLEFINPHTLFYRTGKQKNHALPRLEFFDNRNKHLSPVNLDVSTREVLEPAILPKKPPSKWPAIPNDLQTNREYPHQEHAAVHALLSHNGLKYEISHAWDGTSVAYSDDQKTFLAKLHSGNEDFDYFYGNLETKALHRIKPPTKTLAEANAIEISFVITPG